MCANIMMLTHRGIVLLTYIYATMTKCEQFEIQMKFTVLFGYGFLANTHGLPHICL